MSNQAKLILCILTASLTGVLLAGCTANVAGGTDYPNTRTVAGVVHSSADIPVPGAKVKIIDDANWLSDVVTGKSVVLDSATCDKSGVFSIKPPASGAWNIQIDSKDEGLLARKFNEQYDSAKDTTYKFNLKSYATLSGTVQPDAGTAQLLLLSGSGYQAPVNADKSFSFAAAEGAYAMISGTETGGGQQRCLAASVQMNAGASVTGQTIVAPVNRILVDDFTVGGFVTNLGRLIGGGWWYDVNDSASGSQSTISLGVVSGAEAYAGQSLHAVYALDPQSADPWALMGFFLGKDSTNYDLSSLTSLSFMARGTGTVEIRFYSRMMDSINGNTFQQFAYVLPLPAAWTKVIVPVDSVKLPSSCPAAQQGITWAQVAPTVQIIYFTAYTPQNNPGDTINLWLDDVSLDGMKLETFVK
ncbi:MAG TPA: hypothetical protein VLX68_01970 [Chitinivibrionales bacterium]|nr:hypothetical protein [Chitinivibrionales bacterium]